MEKKIKNFIEEGEKCPNCGGQCWRDEHPDGYAVGLWGCSDCEWSEKQMNEDLLEFTKEQDLPF